MTKKEYKKLFKETFGVEPFTEEEIFTFKAMLFAPSLQVSCCTAGYNRYMNHFIEYRLLQEDKEREALVEQDYIKYLEEKGYKISKE